MKLRETFGICPVERGMGDPKGVTLSCGDSARASGLVQEATENNDVTALCRTGESMLARGDAQTALAVYQQAIALADGPILGHLGEARAYLALNRADDAADSLEIALAIDAASVEALVLLARIRRNAGFVEVALELLERARVLQPLSLEILHELGLTLNRSGRTQKAVEVYRSAIELSPSAPGPHVNLGLIYLQQLADPRAAESEFRAVLSHVPNQHEAAANLVLALHDQGRHGDALKVLGQALLAHPDSVELRWNRSIVKLSLGDYREGWEDYDLRLSRRGGRKLARFEYPDWDGSPLPHARLLVLAEQGVGDEIMFGSCIPDLERIVNSVVLECSPRLAPLYARSFRGVAVHGRERHAPLDWLGNYPGIAAKIAIGSLPRILRREMSGFPNHNGYLKADPARIDAYRNRLKALGSGLTVGVSWRAGTRATRGELRSIELDELQALFEVPNTRFVCLQHALEASYHGRLQRLGIELWDEALSDIGECAALISALDLVVSVDNTNAHLAGALGRPVWVLLHSSPEWRWLRAGEHTPWYPSASLVRSGLGAPWHDAVATAVERLKALATSFGAGATSAPRRNNEA
jgi:tetratricopeptide (TPR) repeat protein